MVGEERSSLPHDHPYRDDDGQPEIAAVAAQQGSDVPFMRPAELATDEAGMMETVFHALDQLPGFDYVMLLRQHPRFGPPRTSTQPSSC